MTFSKEQQTSSTNLFRWRHDDICHFSTHTNQVINFATFASFLSLIFIPDKSNSNMSSITRSCDARKRISMFLGGVKLKSLCGNYKGSFGKKLKFETILPFFSWNSFFISFYFSISAKTVQFSSNSLQNQSNSLSQQPQFANSFLPKAFLLP